MNPRSLSRDISRSLAGSLTLSSVSGPPAFSPLALFLLGERGAWYDPSDLSSMFQDSTGTIPVTAVEQPVGLLLDKHSGLVTTGTNVVLNGDFSLGSSDWTLNGWVISSGVAESTTGVSGTLVSSGFNPVIGKLYKITYTLVFTAAGSFTMSWGNVAGPVRTASGTYTEYRYANQTTTMRFSGATFTGSIDNISVFEVAGNHASQATAASRPVLSARVNMLTYSEEFDNAAWDKTTTTVTTNTAVAPDGTTTADTLVAISSGAPRQIGQSIIAAINATYTMSVYAKFSSLNFFWINCALNNGNRYTYFNLSTGALGTVPAGVTATITDVGGGWYRCTASGINITLASTDMYFGFSTADNSTTVSALGDMGYAWGAQFELSPVVTAYQWITTATVYKSVGFPYYLRFDGVDDGLATASASFAAADKMTLWCGAFNVTTTLGIICELSPDLNTNPNGFWMVARNTQNGDYAFNLRGAVNNLTRISTVPLLFGAKAVLSAAFDMPNVVIASCNAPRINGSIPTLTNAGTANLGASSFGVYPLYIGRRGGASFPYNGNIYSLIIRGVQSTAQAISDTETWVAGKTGVTL